MVQNEQHASRGPGTLPVPAVDLVRVFDEIRPRIRRMVEEVLRDYALLDGSRPFTSPPSSDAPAAAASTQLVRAIEFDSFANLAILILSGKQDADATLAALAGLATAANQFIYATGPDAFAMAPVTAFARTLLAASSATAARGVLAAAEQPHTHDADNVKVDESGFSGALAGQGVANLQLLADWIDANWGGGP